MTTTEGKPQATQGLRDMVTNLKIESAQLAKSETAVGQAGGTWLSRVARELEALLPALDAAIREEQKEVTDGFDAIFGYVPEARDEQGNSLTLAQKIVRLGEMYLAAAYPPKGRSQNGQAE